MPDAATWDYQALAEQARHDIVEIKPLLEEVLEPDVFARLMDDSAGRERRGSTTSSGCGSCMPSPPRHASGAPASSTWPTCSLPLYMWRASAFMSHTALGTAGRRAGKTRLAL